MSAHIATGGLQTTYRVQYGTTLSYGSESPSASLTEGTSVATPSVQLSGLRPATEYHFRIVAGKHLG